MKPKQTIYNVKAKCFFTYLKIIKAVGVDIYLLENDAGVVTMMTKEMADECYVFHRGPCWDHYY